jgi:tRNA threonylcarbamoyladenosine biosynthesis protein TsaE
MGELELADDCGSEVELAERAAELARAVGCAAGVPLVVGLTGDLGSGKTTWVRAMLRALGFRGRVPSPTYTLLEHYECAGLAIVHLDLYRLSGEDELENLGVRDWLGEPRTVLLIEWPERASTLLRRCDLLIELTVTGATTRRATVRARTPAGAAVLTTLAERCLNSPR